MIVDCHSHIWEYPGHITDTFVEEANARARGKKMDLHVPYERHFAAMDSVDKVIAFGMRAQHSGIMTPNQYIADYQNKHPDKVIGFAAVDPTCDKVRDTLEHGVKLGLRGVKLGPIYQNIHPTDSHMMPVYEFCEAHNLPIMIHQGTTFPTKAPLKYSLPILLEDVALAFPDLKLVIAHLGHPWMDDTIVLIRKQPNFYSDISALHYRPWQFYNGLVSAKEYGVWDKLLFGTDFPFTTAEASMDALRNINRIVEGTGMPRFEEQEIEDLIHSPTLKLLGLE